MVDTIQRSPTFKPPSKKPSTVFQPDTLNNCFPLSITSSRVGGNVLPLTRVDRRAPLHGNAGAEGREVILAGVLHDHGILVDVPRRTHLGDVQAGDLVLGGHAVAPDHIDDFEENERSREDEDEIRQHADRLGQELLEPTAIEKAKRSLVGDAIPASTMRPRTVAQRSEFAPRRPILDRSKVEWGSRRDFDPRKWDSASSCANVCIPATQKCSFK